MSTVLKKVVGAVFTGQTVELDGKHFEDCTFSDCTLILRRRMSGFTTTNCTLTPGCKIECPEHPSGMSELVWQQFWSSAASNGENGLIDY